jgi:predicted ATPase
VRRAPEKTVLLRRLEVAGCAVVEEAATDINALSIDQLYPHLGLIAACY